MSRGRAVRRAGQLTILVFALTTALVVIAASVASSAPKADPPGNNGTVKIDRLAFDDHPNNEPHVGCVFEVDFYGFDEGDLDAKVKFKIWPPTGPKTVLLNDTVFIGEDAAGGGTDLDASREYDLSEELAAYTPHPVQGWHVKLIVNAEGSIGADKKHKVFWVRDCEPPPPTTTTTSSTTTTTEGPPGTEDP